MTIPFHKGLYQVRLAADVTDVLACQRLRHACFFGCTGVDMDQFDPKCRHLMVENQAGRLVAAVRFFTFASGSEVLGGYAAQSYDLTALARQKTPMIEVGRFCVAPDVLDTDVLRVLWGALTQLVDDTDVGLLFGCTSFAGTDPRRYGQVFARLAQRHLGPAALRPTFGSAEAVSLAAVPAGGTDPMPPLLRTYLAMGGWVGDHAVVDRAMNTLHVFTCLEVAAVPPARARALRALAPARALP